MKEADSHDLGKLLSFHQEFSESDHEEEKSSSIIKRNSELPPFLEPDATPNANISKFGPISAQSLGSSQNQNYYSSNQKSVQSQSCMDQSIGIGDQDQRYSLTSPKRGDERNLLERNYHRSPFFENNITPNNLAKRNLGHGIHSPIQEKSKHDDWDEYLTEHLDPSSKEFLNKIMSYEEIPRDDEIQLNVEDDFQKELEKIFKNQQMLQNKMFQLNQHISTKIKEQFQATNKELEKSRHQVNVLYKGVINSSNVMSNQVIKESKMTNKVKEILQSSIDANQNNIKLQESIQKSNQEIKKLHTILLNEKSNPSTELQYEKAKLDLYWAITNLYITQPDKSKKNYLAYKINGNTSISPEIYELNYEGKDDAEISTLTWNLIKKIKDEDKETFVS